MSDDSAVEALMGRLSGNKGGNAAPEDNDDEDADEGEDGDENADEADEGEDASENDDEDADEGEDGDKEAAKPATGAPADDVVVKVTVDGQEQEFTVGSLKRLAGQEASLTKKSQEADVVGGRAALMIDNALATVMEDLEPYKGIDWVSLGHEMDPEEFRWHRDNFNRAHARYEKLVAGAQDFEKTVSTRQEAAHVEQVTAAVAELTDPATGIQGWNEDLYAEIMKYGVAKGLPEADVAKIANAKVIKLMHKAMLYDKGQTAVAKKVNLAPARVKRTGGQEAVTESGNKQLKTLEKKVLSGRGSDDDAIALLTGRWGRK